MATYIVTKLDGSTVRHENITNLEVTDRTITGLDSESKDVAFVYPVAAIVSLIKE